MRLEGWASLPRRDAMERHDLIGQRLRHFEILEPLGSGGMGEVFAALDTKLGRRVALKVIPRATADDPDRLERFQHEARALAALNHPDIVTIHSVGEDDGRHFLTMELVEGQTLDQHLASGAFDLGALIGLARPLAEALAVAHDHGIVHRDLKPGNVMVTPEGGIKVLDFGLASSNHESLQSLHGERPASDASTRARTLTATLAESAGITGTLPYMAPEQLRGEGAGPAADVFSLGILIFEMVGGRRPFQGKTFVEVAASILRDPMPPLDPDQPQPDPQTALGRLSEILEQCLAKNPKNRLADAGALAKVLAELEEGWLTEPGPTQAAPEPPRRSLLPWLLTAALVLAALALWPRDAPAPVQPNAAYQTGSGQTSASEEAAERQRIVVLPFRNLGATEDAYFALGISEEITSRLATVDELGVVSRISAQRFLDGDTSSEAIGEALGVDYILSGTVRWERSSGALPGGAEPGLGRVRVTPQLIQASDGVQLWSTNYDRVLEDLFEVQSDIATQVIRALDITLFPRQEQALETRPTESLAAYQAYLRGLYFANRVNYTAEDGEQARRMFEQAVDLDPSFTLAWAQLSQSHSRQIHFGYDRSPEGYEQASQALDRARDLDPTNPEVLLSEGYYLYWAQRDYGQALEALEAAAQHLPNDARILGATAFVERRLGDFDTSTRRLERARRFQPNDPQLILEIGNNRLFQHHPVEARQAFDQTIELAPDNGYAYLLKVRALWLEPEGLPEARRVLDLGIADEHPLAPWIGFWQRAYEGDFVAAREVLDRHGDTVLSWNDLYHPPSLLRAESFLWEGRKDEAHAAYAEARDTLIATDASLEDDPRRLGALAIALAGLGDCDTARDAMDRALASTPVRNDAILRSERQLEQAWMLLRCATQAVTDTAALDTVALDTVALDTAALETAALETAAKHLARIVVPPSRISPLMVQRDPRWRILAEHPRLVALSVGNPGPTAP